MGVGAILACGSGGSPSNAPSPSNDAGGDGASGSCSADIANGGNCNSISHFGPLVTPTCSDDAIPSGIGGTIVDGTYFLTAETFYADVCPQPPMSGTLVITGYCWQQSADGQAAGESTTASALVVAQGNQIIVTPTCTASGASSNATTETFTVSGTTLTLFTMNAALGNCNPDYVSVYTKQ
jgi:hypothetical protein